jgi:phage portal protein BeeE
MMANYQNLIISQQTKNLIEKLLLGKFAVSEIARITGIPEQGLQKYVLENDQVLAQ